MRRINMRRDEELINIYYSIIEKFDYDFEQFEEIYANLGFYLTVEELDHLMDLLNRGDL